MDAQRSEHCSPGRGLLYAFGGTFLLATNYCTAKYAMGGFDSGQGFDPGTFSLVLSNGRRWKAEIAEDPPPAVAGPLPAPACARR